MFYTLVPSPIGELLLAGSAAGVSRIGLPTGDKACGAEPAWQRCDEMFADATRQLAEYFDGTRCVFDLPLQPQVTPFQAEVHAALRRIPYGETRSYGDIAREIGRPRASRAVGAANGSNPLPIVVPCHRVVGANGTLTGYGGGLGTKRYLLDLERRHSTPRANRPLGTA